MEKLFEHSQQLINETDLSFTRYALEEIRWEERLTGITGARGVGKTTLMLQYIKRNYSGKEDALFISLDDLYFSAHTLSDLADNFVKTGGTHLFIDEAHKYPNWSVEIKNIYDRYKKLNIVFSGSSALEIYKGKADLSRRALHYHLNGMSLREFMELTYKIKTPVFTFEEIINDSHNAVREIISKIKLPIKYFNEFLKTGVYPFSIEDKVGYHNRLLEIINQIIETDMPAIYGIDYNSVINIKKLLSVISTLVPFKPNITDLSRKISISRESVIKYLYFLTKADITASLYSDSAGLGLLNKPEKVYLNNPNLFYALSGISTPNIGTIRESFFMQQLSTSHKISYSKESDFLIDRKYTFEIGGKSKKPKQIKNLKNAYVVKDNIEYGHSNTIPLWLFGFLY
jgi:predicted AAA+ superfamily ATPase